MKKLILSLALFSFAIAGFSTIWTVSNSGTTFTPNAITITLGDSVNFSLGSFHNAIEVSQNTWSANDNTPLVGGFSEPFGGGLVLPGNLPVGTHYFVCEPHASLGMKGTITVLSTTGIAADPTKEGFLIFPNPSNGNFQLEFNNSQFAKKYDLGIYNVRGAKVYAISNLQQQNTTIIEISDLPKGIYILRLYGGKDTFIRKIVVK